MSGSRKYSYVILDDESSSRKILTSFIGKYCPQLRLLGEASNIKEGKELIDENSPDIVFLDIEMPHGSAFDLIDQYGTIPFSTIFITAYSQYAIQAFNLSSAKYLLKPVDIDELIKAVQTTCDEIDKDLHSNLTQILMDNLKEKQLNKVIIPTIDGFEVVKTNQIVFIQADDNFSILYLDDGEKYMACRKLKFYEQNLNPFGFVRIHRSTIINVDKVKAYQKGRGGVVIMENGKELDVSQSRKQNFLDQFVK